MSAQPLLVLAAPLQVLAGVAAEATPMEAGLPMVEVAPVNAIAAEVKVISHGMKKISNTACHTLTSSSDCTSSGGQQGGYGGGYGSRGGGGGQTCYV